MKSVINKSNNDAKFEANAVAKAVARTLFSVKNTYHLEAYDSDGNLKWEDWAENIVVNEGLNDLLTNYLKG